MSTLLHHDVYLIHRDYDVFLGGSHDTRLITNSFVTSNFYGTIQRVLHILLTWTCAFSLVL